MTNALDELRGLLDASTPGPWRVYHQGDEDGAEYERWHSIGSDGAPDADWIISTGDWFADEHRHNAALIVFLRNHAEDLLAVARAAFYLRAEQESGDVHLDSELALMQDLDAALARLSPPSEEGL